MPMCPDCLATLVSFSAVLRLQFTTSTLKGKNLFKYERHVQLVERD